MLALSNPCRHLMSFVALVSSVIVGCGGGQREAPEVTAAMKTLESSLGQINAVLESVKDDASAEGAAKKLEPLLTGYGDAFQKLVSVTASAKSSDSSSDRHPAAIRLSTSTANSVFEQHLDRLNEEVPNARTILAALLKKHEELRRSIQSKSEQAAEAGEPSSEQSAAP